MLFKNSHPHFIKSIKLFSCGMLSYFLYHLTRQQYLKYTKKVIKEDEKIDEIPYSYKYYEEFEKMPNEDLNKEYIKSLLNNVLFENTPKGNVIMYYDYDKESFIYYSDVKDICYLYLETVARRYAITFKCKKIVIDIQKEIEIATIKKDKQPIDNDIKKDNGIFASFKSYNKIGTRGSNNTKKKYIIREYANRYSYRGRISDYKFIKKEEYKMETLKDKIDYQTFKKLMNQTNKL